MNADFRSHAETPRRPELGRPMERATLQNSRGRSISFGPFKLYPTARVVEKGGARLALGSRALDILIVLVDRAGQVVSHRELTQRVWRGLVVSSGSLRVHVAGLRKALGAGDGKAGFQYVANVPGQGYCFAAPISRTDSDEQNAPTMIRAETGLLGAWAAGGPFGGSHESDWRQGRYGIRMIYQDDWPDVIQQSPRQYR